MKCPNCQIELVENKCTKCSYSFSPAKKDVSRAPKGVEKVNTEIKKRLLKARLTGERPPWQQPWMIIPKRNFCTKHQYKGLNRLLLSCEEDEYYITRKQIEKYKSAVIPENVETRIVVLWLPPEAPQKGMTAEELKKLRSYPVMRVFEVFPYSQIEGLPERHEEGEKENAKFESVESFIDFLKRKKGLVIEEKGNECKYKVETDKIIIPPMKRFKDSNTYYASLFHELVHWTGSAKRTKRFDDKSYSLDEEYSREELVAEIGSAYLAHIFNIDTTELYDNSVAYIDGWLEKIQKDAYTIVSAGQKAEKALDFLGVV